MCTQPYHLDKGYRNNQGLMHNLSNNSLKRTFATTDESYQRYRIIRSSTQPLPLLLQELIHVNVIKDMIKYTTSPSTSTRTNTCKCYQRYDQVHNLSLYFYKN